MSDENVIQFVQIFPPLYDTTSVSYHNKNVKENCWQKVAEQLNISLEEAKERWKSLRDKYVRQKKKQKTLQVSGAARVERAKWPLMETMSFLDRFIQPRRTDSNIPVETTSTSEDSQGACSEVNCFEIPSLNEFAAKDTLIFNLSSINNPETSKECPQLDLPSSSLSSQCKKTKNKKRKSEESLDDKIVELLQTDDDPNKLFCASIASRMNRLSPDKCSTFQINVLTMLHKLEYEDA